MDLKRLDFGAPAAERDFTHGLKRYFLESASYQRFQEGGKTVLIGNRGAGKSAIFKMLAENYKMRGAYVIELTPEDYSYEMLSRTLTKEAQGAWAKHGAYAAAWKYLIYVLAMKKICIDSPGLKNKETKEIFNYLRDNFQGFHRYVVCGCDGLRGQCVLALFHRQPFNAVVRHIMAFAAP